MTHAEQQTGYEGTPTTYLLDRAGDYIEVDVTDSQRETQLREFVTRGGGEHRVEMETVMQVVVDTAKHYEVVRDPAGYIGVLENRDGQLVSLGSLDMNGRIPLADSKEKSIATVGRARTAEDGTYGGVVIDRTYASNGDRIEVDIPATTPIRRGNYSDDLEIKEHKRRWKKARKIIAGVALGYSVFHSGGAIDMATDGLNAAEDTVYAASPRYEIGDEFDGIKIRGQERADYLNAAADAVAQTMRDLDDGNYHAIRQRAHEFISRHNGDVLEDERREECMSRIDEATSLEQLKNALEAIENHQKLAFEFDDDDELSHFENVKYTTKVVAELLTKLPRSLVMYAAGIKTIEVHTKGEDGYAKGTMVGGYYSSYSHSITMIAGGPTYDKLVSVGIPGVQRSGGLRSVFLHELSHAIDDHTGVANPDMNVLSPDSYDAEPFEIQVSDAVDAGIDFIRGGIIKYPETISTYSRKNASENQAENIAGVIDPYRNDGLAHPNETRRYVSPANKSMMRALIGLERALPGVADYLVSTNERLMRP